MVRTIRPRILVAALGLVSVAVLVVVIAVALPPPEQSVQLPDGSRMTLEGVTRGTTKFHLLETGGLRERFLRLLPGSLLESLRAATTKLECGDEDAIVLWLSGTYTNDPLAEDPLLVVEDDHACEIPLSCLGTRQSSRSWLAGYKIEVLPRSSRRLVLRVPERRETSSTVFAEIDASHLAPRAPELESTTLPAVQSSPEFELTLHAFETGMLEKLTGQRQQPSRSRGWTRLRYDITRNGAISQEWHLQGIDLLDGAGNAFPILATQSSGSQHLVEASPCIEAAWRVRFAIVPHRIAATEADERWKVQGLVLPVTGTQPLSLSATLRGATVELIELTVQNGAEPGSRWLWIKAALSGDFPAPAPHLRCQVEGDGLILEVGMHSRTGGPIQGQVTTEFQLELPAGVQTVDITQALPRVRVVEIVARSTRVAE